MTLQGRVIFFNHANNKLFSENAEFCCEKYLEKSSAILTNIVQQSRNLGLWANYELR